uniref:Odorant receptor n=1 Tax=Heliconius melpomene rosina TaxID=171916 RepID=A0A1S5XXQ1_HELME|nr:olfactory receptor 61 [Heliconius melpomene rosina]
MVENKLSDCFKVNFIFLKIFGLWPGSRDSGYYKYYSTVFLLIILLVYNILLVFNFLSTPRKIDLVMNEVMFLFTEIAVFSKVFLMLFMRQKIFDAFDILNCDAFKGQDDFSRQIIKNHTRKYQIYWKSNAILSNFVHFSQIYIPIFQHVVFNKDIELPVCKYYFLDDQIIRNFFVFWFIYQTFGIYAHMNYNVNVDALIAGLLVHIIAQLKVIRHEIENIKVLKSNKKSLQETDRLQILTLNTYLKHYEALLKYCSIVQDIIGITMFVQFGVSSVIICVVLYCLLMPFTIQGLMFKLAYLFAMMLQIFVPAWLGTQVEYESQKLTFAAYSCEWIPRSEIFKRSLKLFMERGNTSIVLTGWRIFPLSLDTFTSIMKTAYSFFTLFHNIQE